MIDFQDFKTKNVNTNYSHVTSLSTYTKFVMTSNCKLENRLTIIFPIYVFYVLDMTI